MAATFTRSDYDTLQNWRFATSPIPVPAEGLTFEIAPAVWRLESGTLRFMEPVRDVTTGFVFEGSGSMSMEVPDKVELAQLRRFSGEENLDSLGIRFDQLVLRADTPPFRELAEAGLDGWKSHEVARQRHDDWIELGGLDPDARIISALTNLEDHFTVVDMKSERWNWIRFTWDEREIEEIEVTRLDRGYPEVWLSLDQEKDRLPTGRPGKTYEPRVSLEHVHIRADLTRHGSGTWMGKSHTRPIRGEFIATIRVVPLSEGIGSFHFSLHPYAKVSRVIDAEGQKLEFLRDHIGKRAFSLHNDLYDSDLVVLLEEPAEAGEPMEILFEYELEIANYVAGNSWYPTLANHYLESHTARLELTASRKYDVYSMGEKIETRNGKDSATTVWSIDDPTPMVTFSVGDDFKREEIELENAPNIVVFGPVLGLGRGKMIHNVGADVANSVQYFQWLFDRPLPHDELFVTSIAAGHGQAFDGFLHMSEGTFDSEHPGASELFRAHEVAHQWWGHEVGWKTYRDQWLSESFAEYTAMMFIQATMKDGQDLFDEILGVYTNMLQGSLRGRYSKFYRPWLIEMSAGDRNRLGPIDVGRRAGTVEIPGGYVIQSYFKGPLVIHMLRMMILHRTHSDEGFIAILRDFIASHAGGTATTEDFQRILEKHYPGDWSWFINQWIYGAQIPRLEYDIDLGKNPNQNGSYPLTVRIRKSRVPADFIIPVPIVVELSTGEFARVSAVMQQAEQTFHFELPARPRRADFNPDHAVLAEIREM